MKHVLYEKIRLKGKTQTHIKKTHESAQCLRDHISFE